MLRDSPKRLPSLCRPTQPSDRVRIEPLIVWTFDPLDLDPLLEQQRGDRHRGLPRLQLAPDGLLVLSDDNAPGHMAV
jgi:hypothetical protein